MNIDLLGIFDRSSIIGSKSFPSVQSTSRSNRGENHFHFQPKRLDSIKTLSSVLDDTTETFSLMELILRRPEVNEEVQRVIKWVSPRKTLSQLTHFDWFPSFGRIFSSSIDLKWKSNVIRGNPKVINSKTCNIGSIVSLPALTSLDGKLKCIFLSTLALN